MKRWRIGLLGLAISLLAIYFIVSQVDLTQLQRALLAARFEFLLPSALLLVVGLVTRAVRWRVLLNGALPLKQAFSITNVSYLVNGVLPLRMGEVARAVLANRAEPPVPLLQSASSIIVERMLDLLAVLVLLAFALAAGPTLPDEYRTAALVTVPLLLVGFGVLVLLARQRGRVHGGLQFVMQRVPGLQRFDLRAWADHFLDGLLPLAQVGLLLRALVWTAVSWGLSLAAGYILMFAFYEQASWPATALYIAAAAFVIAVPAVPGNFGTYEWAVMLALSAAGYGAAASPANVSFAVVVHALNLAIYAVMGTLGFMQEGITLGQLTSEVQRHRSTA